MHQCTSKNINDSYEYTLKPNAHIENSPAKHKFFPQYDHLWHRFQKNYQAEYKIVYITLRIIQLSRDQFVPNPTYTIYQTLKMIIIK